MSAIYSKVRNDTSLQHSCNFLMVLKYFLNMRGNTFENLQVNT